MAEEVKENKEQEKKDSGKGVKTFLKVILGIVFLGLGAYLIWRWRWDLIALVKGSIGLFLILAGAITLAIAKE